MIYALIAVGGVVIGVGGTFAGFWFYDLYDRANFTPQPPKPQHKETCPCGHVRSMHANGTGKCQSWPTDTYDPRDKASVKCPCQLYDGPGPLITDRTTIVVPDQRSEQRA